MNVAGADAANGQDELAGILDDLIKRCEIKTAVLATRDGTVIQARGDTSYLDVTALAALLGAMFSATREVARMVGEQHFSILLQQGEQRHIQISLIPDAIMLSLIFEDVGQIGRIRLHSRRVASRIAELAGQSLRHQPLSGDASPSSTEEAASSKSNTAEFREYALDLIDRIFAED